jgi:hypothetical protein
MILLGLNTQYKKGHKTWNKGRKETRPEALRKMRACGGCNKGIAYERQFQDRVEPLYNAGKSLREIAEALGSNRMTVQRALKNAGIERRGVELSIHQTYHVNRGVINSVCDLCQAEEVEVDEYAEQYDSQVRHRDLEVPNCRCQGCIAVRVQLVERESKWQTSAQQS